MRRRCKNRAAFTCRSWPPGLDFQKNQKNRLNFRMKKILFLIPEFSFLHLGHKRVGFVIISLPKMIR